MSAYMFFDVRRLDEKLKKICTHSVIFSTTTYIYEVHHWAVDHSQLARTVVATFFLLRWGLIAILADCHPREGS